MKDKLVMIALKYGLIIFFYIVLSLVGYSQPKSNKWKYSQLLYTGMEASFGTINYRIKSDFAELEDLQLSETGGNAGFVLGNEYSRFVFKPLGFYTASDRSGRTIDLFAVEVVNNTSIFNSFLSKPNRFDIYGIAGINFNSYKFFGHYIAKDLRPAQRSRPGKEPFLGKIADVSIVYGVGVEYKLVNQFDFIQIFANGKSSTPINHMYSMDHFQNTVLNDHWEFEVGIRFGLIEKNDKVIKKLRKYSF